MAFSADLGADSLRRTVGQLWCHKEVFMPEGREAGMEGVPLPPSLGVTRQESFESPLPYVAEGPKDRKDEVWVLTRTEEVAQ